jgi:hypothetical protein
MALATRSSWVPYASTKFKFSISHPASWVVSEAQSPGWAVISSRSNSDLEVTWRAVPAGTTLTTVTDELWKTMTNNGYTVVDSAPGAVAGLQARLLTVNGPATGKQRHGNVALIVTGTGRYRIELWTTPGGDAGATALFSALLATFVIR